MSAILSVHASAPAQWVKARVLDKKAGKERDYIVETSTGDLYWGDEQWLVATKCVAVFCITPLYTMGAMLWHAGKLVKDLVAAPTHLFHNIWNIFRDILYGAQVMCVSLYALVNPYTARKWVAQAEKNWHRDVSYQEDFRKKDDRTKCCLPNLIYGIQNAQVFYLAWCFQVRGKLGDKDHPLVRYF
jgi:hypothetical protein